MTENIYAVRRTHLCLKLIMFIMIHREITIGVKLSDIDDRGHLWNIWNAVTV